MSLCVQCLAIFALLTISLGQSHAQNDRCFLGRDPGTCIIIRDCPSMLQLLTKKPLSNEDRLYLQEAQCGFVGKDPKVCCVDNQIQYSSTYRPESTSNTYQMTTGTGHNTGNIGTADSNLLPKEGQCGIDNQDRIVGGEITELDEYPWLALLEYTKPNGQGFYCGGVLINTRYILTAAHCVKGKDIPKTWSLTSVRLGEFNTSSAVDCVNRGFGSEECSTDPIDVRIEERIAHGEYDPYDVNQYHDIALLRLVRPIQYNDFIQPICVPAQDNSVEEKDVGKNMWVAGWGKTESKSESDVKLKVKVPVKANSDCTPRYKQAGVQLAAGQLCAGGEKGKDSCRGDSGGALMTIETNRRGGSSWYAAGIVSFGPSPCGTPGWPGIYTKVNKYTDWIISKLRP